MRLDLPANIKQNFEMVIPIRWGDMDAMGHVNNAVYFRYLETVRIEWFRAIDCLPAQAPQGPVIINAFCSFIRQLEYPGDIRARHFIGEIGRSTIDTYVTLERTDDPGTIYASGGATVIWTDYAAKKSVALPEGMRAALERAY